MRTLTQAERPMPTGMRRSLRAALAGSLMFGGLTTVGFAVTTALTVRTASASPATLFSSTTSGSYSLTVPAGVTGITVRAVGGTGGMGSADNGGQGAIVTATVAVHSGDQLTVAVANNGGTGYGAAGGFGEESGGSAGPGEGGVPVPGSGGGASAVYNGSSPLVVAGGGLVAIVIFAGL